MPARFWQETNSRLRRFTESNSRMLGSRSPPVRKSLTDSPASSPRGSTRGSPSPLKTRTGSGTGTGLGTGSAPANAPSIINFAAEVRRAKKGENRIEEAHKLRLLDNRHLQWRCVNARAKAALSAQRSAAEVMFSHLIYGPFAPTFNLDCYCVCKQNSAIIGMC